MDARKPDSDPPPLKDIPRGAITPYRRKLRRILLVAILITAILLIIAALTS